MGTWFRVRSRARAGVRVGVRVRVRLGLGLGFGFGLGLGLEVEPWGPSPSSSTRRGECTRRTTTSPVSAAQRSIVFSPPSVGRAGLIVWYSHLTGASTPGDASAW